MPGIQFSSLSAVGNFFKAAPSPPEAPKAAAPVAKFGADQFVSNPITAVLAPMKANYENDLKALALEMSQGVTPTRQTQIDFAIASNMRNLKYLGQPVDANTRKFLEDSMTLMREAQKTEDPKRLAQIKIALDDNDRALGGGVAPSKSSTVLTKENLNADLYYMSLEQSQNPTPVRQVQMDIAKAHDNLQLKFVGQPVDAKTRSLLDDSLALNREANVTTNQQRLTQIKFALEDNIRALTMGDGNPASPKTALLHDMAALAAEAQNTSNQSRLTQIQIALAEDQRQLTGMDQAPTASQLPILHTMTALSLEAQGTSNQTRLTQIQLALDEGERRLSYQGKPVAAKTRLRLDDMSALAKEAQGTMDQRRLTQIQLTIDDDKKWLASH